MCLCFFYALCQKLTVDHSILYWKTQMQTLKPGHHGVWAATRLGMCDEYFHPCPVMFIHVYQLLSHVQLFATPMDCSSPGSSVHGILQAGILELPFASPGNLPDSEIKPRSHALQTDSLPSETPRKQRIKYSVKQHCGCEYSLTWYLNIINKQVQRLILQLWEPFHNYSSIKPCGEGHDLETGSFIILQDHRMFQK